MSDRRCSCGAEARVDGGLRDCPRCRSTLCAGCEELHQCEEPAQVGGSVDAPAAAELELDPAEERAWDRAALELELAATRTERDQLASEIQRLRAWFELILVDCRSSRAKYAATEALFSSSWPLKPTRSNPRGGGR